MARLSRRGGETVIGSCGFKSPPLEGRVEIAYYTFPEFEGRGLATAMAAELVAVARRHEPSVIVAAQTLPQRDASHRVLEKLGFRHVATLDHPEDGTVWEWRLLRADEWSLTFLKVLTPTQMLWATLPVGGLVVFGIGALGPGYTAWPWMLAIGAVVFIPWAMGVWIGAALGRRVHRHDEV